MTASRIALVALIGVSLVGCAYNKETIPIERHWAGPQVANQQRVVALAVDEAVESLEFQKLAGKTATLSVTGVFPNPDRDLLDYLAAQVEAKASRAGVRVVHGQPLGAASAPPLVLSVVHTEPPADYRLEVGVSWGGIDTREKVRTDEPLLTKQVSLAVGGILGGYALQTSGDSSLRYVFPGGEGTGSTILMVGLPVGALAWAMYHSPFPKTFTLMGRIRVVVNAIPVGGGVAFQTEGTGASKILVDPGSPEGYRIVTERTGEGNLSLYTK